MTWQHFLALFRFSKSAVCKESTDADDFHDYPDSIEHQKDDLGAVHGYTYTCARCGREFTI
jgi:hypothetical protein